MIRPLVSAAIVLLTALSVCAREEITVIAGSFARGDGGLAADAVSFPRLLTTDKSGNVFLADSISSIGNRRNRVRRIDAATGKITAFAGNGKLGSTGDGGPAVDATFSYIGGIAADSDGNVLISDWENDRIRKVNAKTGIVETIAEIHLPLNMAFDAKGNILVTTDNGKYIQRIDSHGTATIVAGDGSLNPEHADGPALHPRLAPWGLQSIHMARFFSQNF